MYAIKRNFRAKFFRHQQLAPRSFADYSYEVFIHARQLSIRLKRRRQIKFLPVGLNFEATTRCDSRCAYCARENVIKNGIKDCGDMNSEITKKVMKEFSSLPPQKNTTIAPVGLGEPLLHPRFFEIVELLHNKMPYASICANTNGISMDKKKCERMPNCGLTFLTVSLNSHDRGTYKKLNRVDKFDTVVKNTKTLLRIKGNHSPSVIIQVLDVDINRPHYQRFIDFWTPFLNSNDSVRLQPFDNWTGQVQSEKYVKNKPPRKRYPCPLLYSTIMVDKDGYVFPCCESMVQGSESDMCLGNIMKKGIKQMFLKDEQIWRLREIHKKGEFDKLDACRECSAWASTANIFLDFAGKWM